MRHSLSAVVIGGLMILLMGCGEDSDVADGPFIHAWQLDEQQCAEPASGSLCYEVTLGVSDHVGEREGSCRIYPLDTDGSEYTLDAAIAPDLDTESAYYEVVILDGFSIQAGDAPVFEVVLPIVDDEGFWRWQVSCHPGAPG